MPKRHLRKVSGLTLVELAATVTVIGIMMIGLSLGYRSIMYQYQQDTVRQDIRHYGNTVIREIINRMNRAQEIVDDDFNGFTRLRLTRYKDNGLSEMTLITANSQDGIFIDGKLPLDNQLRLPTKGRFRNNRQRVIELKEFEAKEGAGSRIFTQKFNESFWEIELIVRLETDVFPGQDPQVEHFRFHRAVFLPSKYLFE